MRIRFILSHPTVPENVGAAARALVTCGFDELALVANPDSPRQAGGIVQREDPNSPRADQIHLHERARWLAVGAGHILDGARVYPNLAEAIAGTDLAVGTTARHRSFPRPIIDSRGLRAFFTEKGDPSIYVALVFGNEQTGLTNDELALCQIVSAVPIAGPYPSLNLAQAIMVFAYELAYGAEDVPGCGNGDPELGVFLRDNEALPEEATLAAFMEEARAVLQYAGIGPDEVVYRRLLEYFARCNAYEIGSLYTLFKRVTQNAHTP